MQYAKLGNSDLTVSRKTWLIAIGMLAVLVLNGCEAAVNNEENNSVDAEIVEETGDIAEIPEEESGDMSEILQAEADDISKISEEASEKISDGAESELTSTEGWQEAYKVLLDDWKKIEMYDDDGAFSYLEMYFSEEHYSFDKYFLCDIDGNGTPELCLYSTYIWLTAIFTYQEQPVYLYVDRIYGINPETAEAVINGHWHGSGGSGAYEWKAYRVMDAVAEYSMYIDFWDFSEDGGEIIYTVYDVQTQEYKKLHDSTEYDALYTAHVEPCIPFDNYLLYDLSDLSGLNNIQ